MKVKVSEYLLVSKRGIFAVQITKETEVYHKHKLSAFSTRNINCTSKPLNCTLQTDRQKLKSRL